MRSVVPKWDPKQRGVSSQGAKGGESPYSLTCTALDEVNLTTVIIRRLEMSRSKKRLFYTRNSSPCSSRFLSFEKEHSFRET